jgi:hypothetical protein
VKTIQGGCHCGAITYEAEINPDFVVICHCTDCQTFSGSAFRTAVYAAPGSFRLSGVPKIYLKTTQAGTRHQQAFCPECGTPIYGQGMDAGAPISIRVGTCRQRGELVPKVQVWCRSARSWVDQIASLPKVQEQPPLRRG